MKSSDEFFKPGKRRMGVPAKDPEPYRDEPKKSKSSKKKEYRIFPPNTDVYSNEIAGHVHFQDSNGFLVVGPTHEPDYQLPTIEQFRGECRIVRAGGVFLEVPNVYMAIRHLPTRQEISGSAANNSSAIQVTENSLVDTLYERVREAIGLRG